MVESFGPSSRDAAHAAKDFSAFEFAGPGRIRFGRGSVAEIGVEATRLGASVLLVHGSNPDRARSATKSLEAAGLRVGTFSVAGEPDSELVDAGVAVCRDNGCELVIGLGGGSVMDTAKAIAALANNAGKVLDYIEVVGKGLPLEKPALPCIAIPTSSGTGSEATKNAVIGSGGTKASLRSVTMLPRLALVDPELTWTLPPEPTAWSGMDALTQLIEVFLCNSPNPYTDSLCREGIPRAAASLELAFQAAKSQGIQNGTFAAARDDMALASLFSGLALANARLGAVHGLAGTVGARSGAPHGAVCARLLPIVLDANLRVLEAYQAESGKPDDSNRTRALARFAELGRMLCANPEAGGRDGIRWIERLQSRLGIPALARWAGFDYGDAARQALRASSMKGNPVAFTETELVAILERA